MSDRADVIVVGLGAMGSAVLYQLAKRGVRVVGVDRFAPPHAWGSSHGESRITRTLLGEGRTLVPFVQASHRIWRELEAETGESLLDACGVLLIAPGIGVTPELKKANFVNRAIDSARAFGIDHEVLTGEEVTCRFPQFRNLSGDEKACYEPGGGYVVPERCIAVQLRRAGELGAEIRTGADVLSVAQEGDGVRVETSAGTLRADRAVVCAGAWNASLLGRPLTHLLTITRQILGWYALDDVAPYRGSAPCFIWMHGLGDSDYMYGFPPMADEAVIKISTEQYSVSTTVDGMKRDVDPEETREMYRRHVEGRLAGATERVVRSAACMYTVTPDRGFIIDEHPEMDRVMVVSACSGHGFKHSSGIGAAVAEWATGSGGTFDLAPFSLSRFTL